MSLAAVKDDMPEEEKKPDKKKQTILERYERFAADVWENSESLMNRMMQGEKITKDELENQQNMMTTLKSLANTVKIMQKSGMISGEIQPSEEFNDMGKLMEKVKAKKSSVTDIVQKTS